MFNKKLYGMIHLKPLIGSHRFNNNIEEIIDHALLETEIFLNSGIDGIIIENMHDTPYLKNHVYIETVSLISIICHEIKKKVKEKMKIGLQILAGANKEALAVAKCANLDFVRAEGFSYAHFADEGLIEACAGELLRYRKQIDAEHIKIITDIKKKHSANAITQDLDIVDIAHGTEFMEVDGVIVTGSSTGKEASLDEVKRVKKEIQVPLFIGSGITIDNISKFKPYADSFIIGSYFKKDGFWKNSLDKKKIEDFVKQFKTI
jgi:membrane complex biogenesis BtpA family protein